MMHSGRTFSAISNYVSLDRASRHALDTITKQIRQANRLIASTETVASLEDSDGATLTFAYDPYARTLTRSRNGTADTKPLLTECDRFKFAIFQRNPVGGSYEAYPTAMAGTCKLVQMSWICSRQVFGLRVNTESVQSSKIVIRNQ
jgi:hypothetical protein